MPANIEVCLFDLDGVLTDTAAVHARSWAKIFDELLAPLGQPPFSQQDYDNYVDGKPREDGVRDFLRSRGITLPEGSASDRPDRCTVRGVSMKKNALVTRAIASGQLHAYAGSLRYLKSIRAAGLRSAVVSSSANTTAIIRATGLAALLDVVVDAGTLSSRGLQGKPSPDSYLEAARLLAAPAGAAAVFEDAIAGVRSAVAGRFGYVVGINRLDAEHATALRDAGADIVVPDLANLLAAH